MAEIVPLLNDFKTWVYYAGTQLDSLAIVYHLDSNAPEKFKVFWKVSADLLFILDDNLLPRVGDAGYGYELNRMPL